MEQLLHPPSYEDYISDEILRAKRLRFNINFMPQNGVITRKITVSGSKFELINYCGILISSFKNFYSDLGDVYFKDINIPEKNKWRIHFAGSSLAQNIQDFKSMFDQLIFNIEKYEQIDLSKYHLKINYHFWNSVNGLYRLELKIILIEKEAIFAKGRKIMLEYIHGTSDVEAIFIY